MIKPSLMAEYLCNHQPYSILSRLLADGNFASKYDLKQGVGIIIGGKIHLNQHILINAIKRLFAQKDVVAIPDENGNKHSLRLNQGHIIFKSASNEITVELDNLFILSPERDERVKTVKKLVSVVGPISQDFSGLITDAEKGELSYEQIDELLHELYLGVGALQNQAKNAFTTQQATIDNLIPNSMKYYDYFCGPNPGSADPEEYLGTILPDYRKKLIQRDLAIGIDVCIQGAIRDDLMPGAWIIDYNGDDVWDCLQKCDSLRDPFALLGALDVALWRHDDERYATFAGNAIETIVSEEFLRSDGIDVYNLMPSIARLIMNRINSLEEGVPRPPYWKRMCAWMQAGFLIRQTQNMKTDIKGLEDWISANMKQEGNFVTMLDLRREPMYRASEMTAESFREEIMSRIRILRERHKKEGRDIQKSAEIDEAISKIIDKKTGFCLSLPGPLEGHTPSSKKGIIIPEEASKQAIENLFSDKSEVALSNLTYLCQLFAFDKELLRNVRKVIEGTDFDSEFSGFPNILKRVIDSAFIACSQQDKELSRVIGAKIVSASRWVNSEFTSGNIIQALLLAGATFKKESEWRQWIDSQFTEVAYRLPAGDDTKTFLMYIQILKNLLDLKAGILSKAEAIASAAT